MWNMDLTQNYLSPNLPFFFYILKLNVTCSWATYEHSAVICPQLLPCYDAYFHQDETWPKVYQIATTETDTFCCMQLIY